MDSKEYDKGYEKGGEKEDMESLRQINNMMYLRPSQASLTCKRQVKIQPFQTLSANMGDTIQVIVNSGDEFIYGPTSVIKLTYTLTNGTGGNLSLSDFWGFNNCILGIFKSIRVTHLSGQQIEFIDEVGIFALIKRLYQYNKTSRKQLDGLLNYDLNLMIPQFVLNEESGTRVLTSTIPLSILCGVFDSVEIMPPQLVAGMRIELQLKQNSEVLVNNLNSVSAISPYLLLDCVTPYDSVVREIVEQTADTGNSGIQYTYETGFYTSQDASANLTFSLDIQNSVSIASRAFFVLMKNPADTIPKMIFYNNISQLQWRCGAEYFPNQQIISASSVSPNLAAAANNTLSSAILNSCEYFKDTEIAFLSYPHQFGSPQILGSNVDFSTTFDNTPLNNQESSLGAFLVLNAQNAGPGIGTLIANSTGDPNGLFATAVYGQTLDRSPAGIAGKYSGLQTNNARLLNVTATKALQAGAGFIRCWMMSTRVVNLAGNTAIVDR